jgi:hypothetical protein
MPKRSLTLTNPKDRGNGLTQTKIELNYAYINSDSFTVYTVQGNTITVPFDVPLQNFLIALEDAAKLIYDVP